MEAESHLVAVTLAHHFSSYAVCVQFGTTDSVVQLLGWTGGSLFYRFGNGTAYLSPLLGSPHSLSYTGRFRLQLNQISRTTLSPRVSGVATCSRTDYTKPSPLRSVSIILFLRQHHLSERGTAVPDNLLGDHGQGSPGGIHVGKDEFKGVQKELLFFSGWGGGGGSLLSC